jgi:hypothetical protein
MTHQSKNQDIPFEQVLAALLDDSKVFPAIYLHQFTDLEALEIESLRTIWPQVNPKRRFSLLEDLEEVAIHDTLVLFDPVAIVALGDPEPAVRETAVRMLWETEDQRLGPVFLQMLREDSAANVRAAAASSLGRFVYLGELEEISADLYQQVTDLLLKVHQSDDETLVRRRALESLGFSGRKEVAALIRRAYETREDEWLVSALFAMGRSADAAWEPQVMRMLRSPKTEIQFEAVRAAGELELKNTRQVLLDLLEEDEMEDDLRSAAIWSLSQIGGEGVRDRLEELAEETEDDAELEILENALDNLTFTESVDLFEMFDFSDPLSGVADEDLEPYLLTGLEGRKIALDDEDGPLDNLPDDGSASGDSAEPGDPQAKRRRHKPNKPA